jgi:hypothetical protein
MSLKRLLTVFFWDAAVINAMLPTFSVFPFRIFHRCIATGILVAANAKNHMG